MGDSLREGAARVPPVPYRPEDAAALRARFPAAVARVFDVVDPDSDRAGLHPENVFDFPDGLRLIVSRDRLGPGAPPLLHASASVRRGGDVWKIYRGNPDGLMAVILARVRMLTGEAAMAFQFFSDGVIPHYFPAGSVFCDHPECTGRSVCKNYRPEESA